MELLQVSVPNHLGKNMSFKKFKTPKLRILQTVTNKNSFYGKRYFQIRFTWRWFSK